MLGTLLSNRYRVETQIGEGGMGIVYRAHDTLLNRPVAIKRLSPGLIGDEGIKRLLREAQAAAQLTHPNIVSVYDVIDAGDSRSIVMEYVDGQPLAELIPLDVPRAIDLISQVCAALQYAHARGIVHRDIKPENIVVTTDGAAKLMDFGLARSEGRSRMTQSGLIVGTVAYMAPEQVLGGTVDARTDLYSVGCVLYEALTGRKPFGGDDPFTVLSQQVNVTPVAPRWHTDTIPPTLDAVVMRLLAKDPAERYPSATAVIEALNLAASAAAGDEPDSGAVPAGTTTRTTLLEHIVRGKLVGRSAELAELREHLDRMLSGEGRLVLVSGEPGIGKTRLSEELAVYAHLRGARVLRGHCYEQDVGVPYLPFVESLRQLLQQAGDSLRQIGDRAADLARLLPEVGRTKPDGPTLTPEDERVRAFEAAAQWVSLASQAHPLVFLLDDLHWADQASLRLLHHLARSTRTDRVLITGTYREMELDTEHPLNDAISQMNRERLFYRLPLRRLSEEDTRALLSGLFDVETSQELAGAIHRETEGNPFFIEEVVKALVEEGKIYREGGRWQRLEIDQLEIPQSVKAAIGRRFQKAGESTRRILTIAAVMGREFNPEVLVQIAGVGEDAVLDALDDATRLQLIREVRIGREAGYTFVHALIRQTLYEALNARRRMRLHEQIGTALEAIFSGQVEKHVEELAYHFGESGASTAQKGIEYNLRAAAKAAGMYALDEAERRIRVALELAENVGDAPEQVRVLQSLGDLHLASLEYKRAAEAYDRAVAMVQEQAGEESEELLTLYLKFAEATVAFAAERPPQAIRYAQAAVKLLQDQPEQPRKALALALLAMHEVRSGALDAAHGHAQEAIALAERLGATEELIRAHQAMASVHRSSNEWTLFGKEVETCRSLRGGILDANLCFDLIQHYENVGNYAEATRLAREFLELAEQQRSPTAVFRATNWLGASSMGANRWDEALQFTQRAIELGSRLRSPGLMLGWSMVRASSILLARGREEEAREMIARIENLQYEVPPEHHSARLAVLQVARRLGDLDLLRRLLARLDDEHPRCLTCQFVHNAVIGMAAVKLGDVAAAQTRVQAAERVLPEKPGLDTLGDLAWFRAQVAEALGDYDEAVRQIDECVRLHSEWRAGHGLLPRSGEPMEYALALRWSDAARMHLRRGAPGDRARAEELLVEALQMFRTVGARRDEALAQTLLDAAAPSAP